MRTVADLFRRLEEQRLAYAVLRNYENLPGLRGGGRTRNTDIDLVVETRDMPRLRELLATLAAEFGWDVLTECGHYARSQVRHHNIEVFQFYRTSPVEYLQVDVFHGFLVWGLPFMEEEEMLRGRQYDPVLGLTHIDPLKEQIFRLIQIHGLGQSARTAVKRERYRGKIDAFREHREQEFLASVRRYFGPFGVDAVTALRDGDTRRFIRAVSLGKTHFFARYALRHPVSALMQVAERRRDSRSRFHGDPCGSILTVNADTGPARSRFEAAMDRLIELNVFDEWLQKSWSRELTHREQDVLEQGGLLVSWTNGEHASIVVEDDDDPAGIAAKVLNACLHRHPALYVNRSWAARVTQS